MQSCLERGRISPPLPSFLLVLGLSTGNIDFLGSFEASANTARVGVMYLSEVRLKKVVKENKISGNIDDIDYKDIVYIAPSQIC